MRENGRGELAGELAIRDNSVSRDYGMLGKVVEWQMRDAQYCTHELPRNLPSAINTGFEESWSTIGSWLRKCDAEHSACHTARNDWNPTRLLKISHSNSDESSFSIRLVEPLTVQRMLYVALSHCWGGNSKWTLTSESQVALKAGIACRTLPKTFRDAVVVVAKLGLEYLWIDCLCIMQDSVDDWQHEASQMYLVYANAHVTVAATGSRDSSGGLFFDRDPKFIGPCIFRVHVNNRQGNSDGPIVVGDFLGKPCDFTCVLMEPSIWEDGIELAPLSTRAWAFQERLLSGRILHFAREQVFWECRCHVTCEAWPDGTLRSFGSPPYEIPKKIQPFPVRIPVSDETNAAAVGEWALTLTRYTTCELTFDTDRLIAISGLARIFSKETHSRYFAGMWEKDLVLQLGWFTIYRNLITTTLSRRTTEYVAPSWSWISMIGLTRTSRVYVRLKYKLERRLAWVKSVNVQLKTNDPFGQLRNGVIRLAVVAMSVEIVEEGGVYLTRAKLKGAAPYYDFQPETFPLHLTFLPLYQGEEFDENEIWSLLVEPIDTNRQCYKRVGMLRLHGDKVPAALGGMLDNLEENQQEVVII